MNIHFIRKRPDGTVSEKGNCDETVFALMQLQWPNEYFRDDGTTELTPLPPPVETAAMNAPVTDAIEDRLKRIEARLDALEK